MMRLAILTLVTVCALVSFADAQGLFRNPDGRPGTYAIEPYFVYDGANGAEQTNVAEESIEDINNYRMRDAEYGLRLLIPVAEWGTILARGSYGHYEEKWMVDTGAGDLLTYEINRPEFSFGMSIRIWIFDSETDYVSIGK
jgi:hypothetical protein